MTTPSIQLHFIRHDSLTAAMQASLRDMLTAEDEQDISGTGPVREQQSLQRGLRRHLLAQALEQPATALRFQRSSDGKPELPGHDIAFSISHTDTVFALAWSHQHAQLGLDLETLGRRLPRERLASRYFSPAEQAELAHATDPGQRFLEIWTRKEALVKAHGMGLRLDIAALDTCACLPGEHDTVSHPEIGNWRLHTLLHNDHAISLAWPFSSLSTRTILHIQDNLPFPAACSAQ